MNEPRTKISSVDAILRAQAADRTLPAESEHFRNHVWNAISKISLNAQGLTLGKLCTMFWEVEGLDRRHAEQLTQAMSEYCYNAAMSTSVGFNCAKQLFDECPTQIRGAANQGLQALAQHAEYVENQSTLKDWEMLCINHRLHDDLSNAAMSVCNEFGMKFHAIGTVPPHVQRI